MIFGKFYGFLFQYQVLQNFKGGGDFFIDGEIEVQRKRWLIDGEVGLGLGVRIFRLEFFLGFGF